VRRKPDECLHAGGRVRRHQIDEPHADQRPRIFVAEQMRKGLIGIGEDAFLN
jgi:hypothetical protein